MLPTNWPRWSVVPIGFGLVIFTILIGLVLDPAVQAITPHSEPTPTLVHVPYAAPLSTGCVSCHTDEAILQASAGGEDVQHVLISDDEVISLHGRLGCVTCHSGNGQSDDKETAHQGLISDPSDYREAGRVCLACHEGVPNEIPEDHIQTPHERILWGIHEGREVCSCSNCHGPVAHGVAPVRTHEGLGDYCIHCHEEQDVPPERLKCAGCHIGPHDVTDLDCETCHISTETWSSTQLAIHPLELNGRHAELACFECHTQPLFRTISGYTCQDCHAPYHEFGAGQNCGDCHTDGYAWNEVKEGSFDHTTIWDYHVGAHTTVACQGCHFEDYAAIPSNCDSCHQLDPDTCNAEQACTDCHLSDTAWSDVR